MRLIFYKVNYSGEDTYLSNKKFVVDITFIRKRKAYKGKLVKPGWDKFAFKKVQTSWDIIRQVTVYKQAGFGWINF